MAKKSNAITGISVRGFKSICDEQYIEIRPLTILAGANSSGKSSIMQPLLLLKQTLEAPGDPGALLLDGPNVRFTSSEQLLSKGRAEPCSDSFSIRIEVYEKAISMKYSTVRKHGFDVMEMTYSNNDNEYIINTAMNTGGINKLVPNHIKEYYKRLFKGKEMQTSWRVSRERCFLAFELIEDDEKWKQEPIWRFRTTPYPIDDFIHVIQSVIHLPGLRGNPRRTYPKMAVGPYFQGTFEDYVASLVYTWQSDKDKKLGELGRSLEELELSWKVTAEALDDTQVELRVGRLPHGQRGGAQDLVSIADVGLGISQSLPVLVALIVARQGQLVYLEQPEIHLHPKAQRKMANLLCNAANRGVNLIVETHSALLLREVQTLIAMGKMQKDNVRLHWFQRGEEGDTVVTTAGLDDNGAYGDWPEDFDITELEAEKAYLNAIENKGTDA